MEVAWLTMRPRLLAVVLLAGCGPVAPFDGVYSGDVKLTGACGRPVGGVLASPASWGLVEHPKADKQSAAVLADMGPGCDLVVFFDFHASSVFQLGTPISCPGGDLTAKIEQGSVEHAGSDGAKVSLSGQALTVAEFTSGGRGCFFQLDGVLRKRP